MTASPLTVSVVVPVYNGEATIGTCLQSLLGQTYPREAFEVIVVENGSTDATSEVVARYPVQLLHSQARGPAAARNVGISASQADIVAFTDADCVADANWLLELVQPYADSTIGGVGGAILAYDHPGLSLVEEFSHRHSPLINFASGQGEYLPHLYTANASYRRMLLAGLGGFRAALLTAEDVDLAWRLQLETTAGLAYAPKAIVHHYHRTTHKGLARQYRHYGFGEILLDTLYSRYPGYPRTRRIQLYHLLAQLAALPRYALSVLVRRVRHWMGRATAYEASEPLFWLLIEASSIRGKLDGLIATRLMADARPALGMEPDKLIARLYPSRKE